MGRIRTIKPEFFLDEELASLDPLDRLAFVGLWTQADRNGRMKDRPSRLKVQILPYDVADFDEILSRLESHGFIVRYEVEGHNLIEIKTFTKHQRPHHTEVPGTLPGPHGEVTVKPPLDHGDAPDGREGKGREGKGVGKGVQRGKKARETFIPPTRAQVAEYVQEKGLLVNPSRFFDYFEATNWIDSQGKRVHSWKGKLQTWDSKARELQGARAQDPPAPPPPEAPRPAPAATRPSSVSEEDAKAARDRQDELLLERLRELAREPTLAGRAAKARLTAMEASRG